MRIGLDLDDTIFSWWPEYIKRFNGQITDKEITYNVTRKLIHDREFWVNLPVINRPDFEPTLYCTKRINCKAWSKEALERNDLPKAPVYQVYIQSASKGPRIKGRVDVFIDDSIDNFIDLNLRGIPCLLMDAPNNQHWGPFGRVYSLNYSEIEDCYRLFKKTVFDNFRELVGEFNRQ